LLYTGRFAQNTADKSLRTMIIHTSGSWSCSCFQPLSTTIL